MQDCNNYDKDSFDPDTDHDVDMLPETEIEEDGEDAETGENLVPRKISGPDDISSNLDHGPR